MGDGWGVTLVFCLAWAGGRIMQSVIDGQFSNQIVSIVMAGVIAVLLVLGWRWLVSHIRVSWRGDREG